MRSNHEVEMRKKSFQQKDWIIKTKLKLSLSLSLALHINAHSPPYLYLHYLQYVRPAFHTPVTEMKMKFCSTYTRFFIRTVGVDLSSWHETWEWGVGAFWAGRDVNTYRARMIELILLFSFRVLDPVILLLFRAEFRFSIFIMAVVIVLNAVDVLFGDAGVGMEGRDPPLFLEWFENRNKYEYCTLSCNE